MNYHNSTELITGLTLILEKNRNTLSVSEIEILMNAKQTLKDERAGVFKYYILPVLIRLIMYLPVFLDGFAKLHEVIK